MTEQYNLWLMFLIALLGLWLGWGWAFGAAVAVTIINLIEEFVNEY